jgi:hypothetical protein
MDKAIIAIARDENKYLDEWISYYKAMGFNSIYIWDNNDPEDESIYEVTNKYPFVTVQDVRGRESLLRHGMQRGCYQQTYDTIKDKYDWIGIFDIDEFLYTPIPIDEFITKPIFDDTGCIHFNWRYYGDNDLIFYDPRPVQERFSTPCPDNVQYNSAIPTENSWVKSLIRGKCNGMNILVHSAFHDTLKCRHANGSVEDGHSELSGQIDFSNGYVKHYGTKTLTEYIERKCLNTSNACDAARITASTRLDWFFNVNKHTPLKDTIANWFYSQGL